MSHKRRRGPGLAGKLLLSGMALLVIPWLGYKTLQASRDFLLQGQAQAQLLSASAVANLFHDRSDLFTATADAGDNLAELPLYRLQSHILLDGLEEDWDLLAPRRQRFEGDELGYDLLLGQRDGKLYGLLRVDDDSVINHSPADTRLDRGDHLRLYFIDSEGAQRRLLLSFEGSGQTTAHEMDSNWRQATDRSPVHLLRGHVERDDKSYVLEFSMPLGWLGEQRQLGVAVADVHDNKRRKIAELLRTFIPGDDNRLNLLVERSAETDRILQALAPRDSRIWIVDRLGHVKASRGQLEAPKDRDTPAGWRGLAHALQTSLSEMVLGIPLGPTRDFDPDTTAIRQDPLLQRALLGESVIERRTAVAGSGEIIAAAQPIYNANIVIGAVLVEKSTRQVLGLQRQSIERLAALTALTIALVALALLGFAVRLTFRIRRLDREADSAIDPYGKLSDSRILHELDSADEIGELARSFNRMLDKLQGHQQFLAAIPRTLRHEINNPLNTISTSIEQLEGFDSVDGRQQLDAAKRALQRINLLVENLSEAASLEQALESESTEVFDLGVLIRNYSQNRLRRPPHPRLEVNLPPGPAMLRGSDFHIEQLLDKLIDNAIDFAADGSTIAIGLQVSNDYYLLTIGNTGPAIADDQLAAIFQLMHSTRKSGSGGGHYGLGLYVAKRIAEMHGGGICAKNLADNSGVVFEVRLATSL